MINGLLAPTTRGLAKWAGGRLVYSTLSTSAMSPRVRCHIRSSTCFRTRSTSSGWLAPAAGGPAGAGAGVGGGAPGGWAIGGQTAKRSHGNLGITLGDLTTTARLHATHQDRKPPALHTVTGGKTAGRVRACWR